MTVCSIHILIFSFSKPVLQQCSHAMSTQTAFVSVIKRYVATKVGLFFCKISFFFSVGQLVVPPLWSTAKCIVCDWKDWHGMCYRLGRPPCGNYYQTANKSMTTPALPITRDILQEKSAQYLRNAFWNLWLCTFRSHLHCTWRRVQCLLIITKTVTVLLKKNPNWVFCTSVLSLLARSVSHRTFKSSTIFFFTI